MTKIQNKSDNLRNFRYQIGVNLEQNKGKPILH